MSPCSCSSAKEVEEAAGWVKFWAGETEEEGWTEAGGSVGMASSVGIATEAVPLLVLLLVAGGLRATAELDRSVARSSL